MIIVNKEIRVNEETYTTGGRTGDKIKEEIESTCSNRIDIASAFFSNPQFIIDLIDTYEVKKIRLIVRLNTGTNPEALRQFINRPGIQVRFFFADTFHPKFYILKEGVKTKKAFVGSANLTIRGMTTNDEVTVKVEDKNDLELLDNVFASYWRHDDARPLTELELNKFVESSKNTGGWEGPGNGYGDKDNVNVDNNLIEYMKTFQDWNYNFNNIIEKYKDAIIGNRRKVPDVPLPIEIDGFFSFIYARNQKDGAPENPSFNNDVEAWIYCEDALNIQERYDEITNGFSIANLSNGEMNEDSLIKLIYALHSPDVRNQNNFFNHNELNDVIRNIHYLLHGDDEEENQYKRMYDLIHRDRHIHYLGESCIQELVGWFKFNEGFPIRNERSKNVMDFYMNVAENN